MTIWDMLDTGIEIHGHVEIRQAMGCEDLYATLFDDNFDKFWCAHDMRWQAHVLNSRVAYMYPKVGDYRCDPALCIELAQD